MGSDASSAALDSGRGQPAATRGSRGGPGEAKRSRASATATAHDGARELAHFEGTENRRDEQREEGDEPEGRPTEAVEVELRV